MPKIEERLASAKPHERVAGRIVGVSNREPGTQHPASTSNIFLFPF